MTNSNLTERIANLAEILPAADAAGTYLSAAFTFQQFRHIVAIIQVGTPGSGGTVDAHFEACATAGGSYVTIAATDMVQMVAAGIQQIEMRADRVNATGVGPYFKLAIVVAVAASPVAAVVIGADARYEPGSQFNDATVLQPAVIL